MKLWNVQFGNDSSFLLELQLKPEGSLICYGMEGAVTSENPYE